MNYCKKNLVFVPNCLLCPINQAVYDQDKRMWSKEIISFLLFHNVDIIQMPCPETIFWKNKSILNRKPYGIKFYENDSEFVDLCNRLGKSVVDEINTFLEKDCNVVAILGIEHSPTCSISYMYTNKGTVHREGIFINCIHSNMISQSINVPLIGINRLHYKKALKEVTKLL